MYWTPSTKYTIAQQCEAWARPRPSRQDHRVALSSYWQSRMPHPGSQSWWLQSPKTKWFSVELPRFNMLQDLYTHCGVGLLKFAWRRVEFCGGNWEGFGALTLPAYSHNQRLPTNKDIQTLWILFTKPSKKNIFQWLCASYEGVAVKLLELQPKVFTTLYFQINPQYNILKIYKNSSNVYAIHLHQVLLILNLTCFW